MDDTKYEVISKAENCEIYESNENGWVMVTRGTLFLENQKIQESSIYMFRIKNEDENQPCIQENMWKQVIILPIEITKNSCDDPFYYFAINNGSSFCGIRFINKRTSKTFNRAFKKIGDVKIIKSYSNSISFKKKCHSFLKKLKPSKVEKNASDTKLNKPTFINKFTELFSEVNEIPTNQLENDQEILSNSKKESKSHLVSNNKNLNQITDELTEDNCLPDDFSNEAPIAIDTQDQLNSAICNFKKVALSRTDLTIEKSSNVQFDYLKNELAKRNEYLKWSDSETESEESY